MNQKVDKIEELAVRARELLKETKALQIVKSANMLIDLFGVESAFEKIKHKRIGQQIEFYLQAIDKSLTFTFTKKKDDFKAAFGAPAEPISRIIFNVKEEKILKTISKILVIKDNLFGLVKLMPLLITRKIKIKGSLFAAIVLCRCMMMGKHEMYKGQL